jgi:hypothetical protein
VWAFDRGGDLPGDGRTDNATDGRPTPLGRSASPGVDAGRVARRVSVTGAGASASKPRPTNQKARRRLVITVCPREPGVVVLPVSRAGRARRLDAAALARSLRELVAARGLTGRVEVVAGCAGGCGRSGPNVDARVYSIPRPGEKPSHVAVGWKTYVYSLAALDCVATILDENLRASE